MNLCDFIKKLLHNIVNAHQIDYTGGMIQIISLKQLPKYLDGPRVMSYDSLRRRISKGEREFGDYRVYNLGGQWFAAKKDIRIVVVR